MSSHNDVKAQKEYLLIYLLTAGGLALVAILAMLRFDFKKDGEQKEEADEDDAYTKLMDE